MDVRTYRATTMHDALQLVRHELGPDAAVLHTREVQESRMFGLLPGTPQIEVTASAEVHVPSRLAPSRLRRPVEPEPAPVRQPEALPDESAAEPEDMRSQIADLQRMVSDLCRQNGAPSRDAAPEGTSPLLAELLDAELSEEIARELIERVGEEWPEGLSAEPQAMKARIAELVEQELHVTGPIVPRADGARVVALVGPTGVGKTTTIAKLAANFQLRDRCRVGLITVDTYRIAAAEQLRTYAEIMNLPMQVVSTPSEMREAVDRFRDFDVVLIDTAGRSPKDEVKIRELEAFLAEAGVDEVHLVLSAVAGQRALVETARRFAAVGATALLPTKLDEATGLGGLLPVVRQSGLPVSYLTHGQEVPDDIESADLRRLARMILGMPCDAERE